MTVREAELQLALVYVDYVRGLKASVNKMVAPLPVEMKDILDTMDRLRAAMNEASLALLALAGAA